MITCLRSTARARLGASVLFTILVATGAAAHPGSGIAVDKDGQVYFTDTGHRLCKIDAQGRISDFPGSRFHWLALDPDGRFANVDKSFGEWFERATPKGSRPTIIQCSDFPLTMGRDGNLYYADTRPRFTRIVRRTADGKETVLAQDPRFEHVDGLACASDGSLYFTECGPDATAIRKITMDGKVSTIAEGFVGKERIKDPPADTPAGYCRALDVDADGVVYVAATGTRRVLRIGPQGQVTTLLDSPAPWQPTGVALHEGVVYVLEWREPAVERQEDRAAWLPRVRKIARDGAVSTLATVSR